MFENNNMLSFFAGVLLVAGLGAINGDKGVVNMLGNGTKVDEVVSSGVDVEEGVVDFKIPDEKIIVKDSEVSEKSIQLLNDGLDKIPTSLLKRFYSKGFKIELYKSIEGSSSVLDTNNKVMKISANGVKGNKYITEFAYFLDYQWGISKNGDFRQIYEIEGDGYSSSKSYLVNSFISYILRLDSLKEERPLTYKYLTYYLMNK